MKPHEQRVVVELAELKGKHDRLRDFSRSSMFDRLPITEKELLLKQFTVMLQYIQILQQRIAIFT